MMTKVLGLLPLPLGNQNSRFCNQSLLQFVVTDSTYVFPLHPRLTFAQVFLHLFSQEISSSNTCLKGASLDTLTFPQISSSNTYLKGASLGVPFFTAYKALILRAKTKPGETVLVHGARYTLASVESLQM